MACHGGISLRKLWACWGKVELHSSLHWNECGLTPSKLLLGCWDVVSTVREGGGNYPTVAFGVTMIRQDHHGGVPRTG